MLRFYADKFVELTNFVSKLRVVAEHFDTPLSKAEDKNDAFLRRFRQLQTVCEELGLGLSVKQIIRIEKQFLFRDSTAKEVKVLLDNLNDRINDELSDRLCMVIPQKKADFYEQSNLFGDAVFNNFPSATFDIEEAGKCFAMARYTACVMHLQRALETALKSYGNCLSVMNLITTAQPSWQTVLDKTAKEIKDRNDRQNTNTNWSSNEEKDFCEGVQPFLVSVKTAWRNPSMHADKTYSEEIAEDIFSAVKRFMKHLAEHLDEAGNFTA